MGLEELDTGVPHSARIYDYVLGGKDNFQADRDAAQEMLRHLPSLPVSMRANRNYMVRVGRYLAVERGLRQYLDIGTGLPTSPNLHEVVQAANPAARVLYVDKDPIVLVHARALLTSTPQGRTAYLDADLRDIDSILRSAQLRDTFDLSEPVAVSLIAILQFITDEEEARRILSAVMAPLASGSTLALSVVTTDADPAGKNVVATYNARGIVQKARDRAEVEALFDGLHLLDPGVVPVHRWQPDTEARGVPDQHVHMYGGVAVKP
jgi:O-methyltransferase involved in polyketide biosynthesis